MTTRALVLARGRGTRMRAADAVTPHLDRAQRAAADAGLKAMIPFGRPFLDYVLHSLAESGIRRVAIVLGPEHEAVREYYRRLPTRRLTISFVIQPEPLGTADAVAFAESWAEGASFLALNADNLYPVDVLKTLASENSPALPGFEPESLGLPTERLAQFALVERRDDGCLTRIVEKPGEEAIARSGASILISMNVWRFDERIFDACRDVPLSPRGERELPAAVGLAASRGVCFKVFTARGPVLDLSRQSDIPTVARQLAGAEVEL